MVPVQLPPREKSHCVKQAHFENFISTKNPIGLMTIVASHCAKVYQLMRLPHSCKRASYRSPNSDRAQIASPCLAWAQNLFFKPI